MGDIRARRARCAWRSRRARGGLAGLTGLAGLAGLTATGAHAGRADDVRDALASPELSYFLLAMGVLALLYELASPGLGVAGALGAVLVVLGLVALSGLEFRSAGLPLLLLAAVLLAAELFTPVTGAFAAAGTVALLAAGAVLFDEEGIGALVLWPVALVAGAGALLAGRLAWRARETPLATGTETFVGREAVVRHAESGTGQVLLEGAWWTVRGRDGPVAEGERVRVVGTEGLDLVVESADPEEESP